MALVSASDYLAAASQIAVQCFLGGGATQFAAVTPYAWFRGFYCRDVQFVQDAAIGRESCSLHLSYLGGAVSLSLTRIGSLNIRLSERRMPL